MLQIEAIEENSPFQITILTGFEVHIASFSAANQLLQVYVWPLGS